VEFQNKEYYKGLPGVYRIRNLVNGHSYIGKTKDLYTRYLDHKRACLGKGKGSNRNVVAAAKKYGAESLVFEVVAVTSSSHVAGIVESHFLRKHLKPEYNIADDTISHLENSNAKQVIHYTSEGDFVRIYASGEEAAKAVGCSASAILKAIDQNISNSAMGYLWTHYQDDPPMKIDPVLVGSRIGAEKQKYWNQKNYSISEWDLNGNLIQKFTDINDAVKSAGVTRPCFNAHLRGEYSSANGKVYTLNDAPFKTPNSLRKQRVRKFSLEGELIKIYSTVKEAAAVEGCDVSTIREAIRLKRGTNYAVGAIWAYDDETTVTPILLGKRNGKKTP
jgi:group I intron endonuclease